MTTLTLAQFLLLRIEEDERQAVYALSRGSTGELDYGGQWYGVVAHAQRWTPDRVLAECEGRRRIVRLVEGQAWADLAAQDIILQALARPYVDHPDWQAEWGRGWRP
jgi:hypothetical protein